MIYDLQESYKAFNKKLDAFSKKTEYNEIHKYVSIINNNINILNGIVGKRSARYEVSTINKMVDNLNQVLPKVLPEKSINPYIGHFSCIYEPTARFWEEENLFHNAYISFLRGQVEPKLSTIRTLLSNDKNFDDKSIIDSINNARDALAKARKNLKSCTIEGNNFSLEEIKNIINKTETKLENFATIVNEVKNSWSEKKINYLNI